MFHNCFHVLLQNNDITLLAVSNAWCQRKTSSDYTVCMFSYNNSMIAKTEALAPMGQRKFLNFTALEWLKTLFVALLNIFLSVSKLHFTVRFGFRPINFICRKYGHFFSRVPLGKIYQKRSFLMLLGNKFISYVY